MTTTSLQFLTFLSTILSTAAIVVALLAMRRPAPAPVHQPRFVGYKHLRLAGLTDADRWRAVQELEQRGFRLSYERREGWDGRATAVLVKEVWA